MLRLRFRSCLLWLALLLVLFCAPAAALNMTPMDPNAVDFPDQVQSPSGSGDIGDPYSTNSGSRRSTFSLSSSYPIYIPGYVDYEACYDVLDLVNEQRAANGLSPVIMDQTLLGCAQFRAAECSLLFSHTRPSGDDCFSILDEVGYGYYSAGENIAWNYSSPASVMTGWMNSSGHRANILNSSYTAMGVGCFYQPGTGIYWVQIFSGGGWNQEAPRNNEEVLYSFELSADPANLEDPIMVSTCVNWTMEQNESEDVFLLAGDVMLDPDSVILTSSNRTVAVTAENYIVNAVSPGRTSLTAAWRSYPSYKVTTTLTVKPGPLLPSPSMQTVQGTNSGVQLTWRPVSGAAKYRVFRKVSGASAWTRITDTTSTTYTDTSARAGTTYIYTVRCINPGGTAYTSTYNSNGWSITYAATPALPTVSNGARGVHITWTKPVGAVKYRVYRRTAGSSWSALTTTSATSYVDTTAKQGITYAYTVRCVNSTATQFTSGFNATGRGNRYLTAPTVTPANVGAGILVKWTPSDGAAGYYVYRKAGSGSYSRVATVNGNTLQWGDTSVRNGNGTLYTYTVRAYYGTSLSPFVNAPIVRLLRPSITGLSSNSAGAMTVTWNTNSVASGYQIYYKTGSTVKITAIAGSASKTRTLTGLSRGRTYTVYVRSYRTVGGVHHFSGWSEARTVTIR